MKIMHIDQQYRHSGGAEQYLLSITKKLEELGHEIIIVYGLNSTDAYHVEGRKEYCIPGIEKIPSLTNRNSSVLKLLVELIKSEKPDVIHVHNVRNFSAIKKCTELKPTVRFIHDPTLCCFRDWKLLPDLNKICTKQVGINCVIANCFNHYHENPLSAIVKKNIEINVHKQLNRIIVSSNYMKDLLIQNGISSDKIIVLPYFTPITPINLSTYPSNENIVLYVGLIHLVKGVAYLLSALKYIDVDFKAIIIGQGSYMEEYKNFSKELGIQDKVNFLGWVPNENLGDYYQKASLLVVPSMWIEAFGIIGIEAMAHARPVVAFNTGGIPDWLEDGVTGYLVDRGDFHKLAEKITFLLKNKELAQRLGENGRLKVLSKFQIDTHIEKLIDIYKEIYR